MNYCTRCESYYWNPGTCNCFRPYTLSLEPTIGFVRTECPGCHKLPCDGSTSACPLPGVVKVTVKHEGGETVWYDADGKRMQISPTQGAA